MDKDILEAVKKHGLIASGSMLLGGGMQLFLIGEYFYSLLFFVAGNLILLVRELRKVTKHGKGKK